MSRRVRSLLVAGVLFVVLFVLTLTLPVPYVALTPGPTFNTLGVDENGAQVVTINGYGAVKANATTGHLNMTTVNESTDELTPVAAISGWLAKDTIVVPRSSVITPGQSQQQVDQQNQADFVSSQDNATAAALCYLGFPQAFGVIGLVDNSPSAGKLHVGDQLVSVDGTAATSVDALSKALAGTSAGQTVSVVVDRLPAPRYEQGRLVRAQGTRVTERITLGARPKGTDGSGGFLGIEPGTGCLAPLDITITLADVGGPSAGLMFTLGILDKIGPLDLTHGRFVAGTGEIDAKGDVGPIGGIQLKMIAARRAGATVFLAPSGNCGDVRGAIPSGLDVIKVSTLSGAVQALQRSEAGQSVDHC